jgi:uroporphyrinogen decarboxylase
VASVPFDLPSVQASKPLLRVLSGERLNPAPVWMMRQAGRYLPEYRALRQEKGGFLELVYDSNAAAEITVQPLRRFPEIDAAILFSDILIVPYALGQKLTFVANEGPRLFPPLSSACLDQFQQASERLEPIYETVRQVRSQLSPDKALIGFAGAPWTVSTYMVAGQGSRDQSETRALAYSDPAKFAQIISRIEELTVEYLAGQIAAGADCVQLFDSWAGSLAPQQFERWVIEPAARIVSALKKRHSDVPIIGFPKGAGGKLGAYARETGVDAVGIDETVDPKWADSQLPPGLPVQGNLDPLALLAGGEALRIAVGNILDAFATRPHIFNLGHGIVKETPIAHVEELMTLLKGRK